MSGAQRFEGKTALVTGASQGIGEAVAKNLARAGARVVVAARSVDKLEALAQKLKTEGAEVLPLALDLGDAERISEIIKGLPKDWEIDVLVNNAGITKDNLLARMTLDDWQQVLDVNLTGTFAVTKAVLRGMMRRRWGRIVCVSSVVGLMGNPGQANYAASKAGLIGFVKSLARELASRSITANVVAPGYVRTEMTDRLPESVKAELASAIPLHRLGTVEDIANAVAFLASEEAGYITGHTLNVSGGLYI